MTNFQVMESTIMQMVVDTQDSGKIIKNMEKDNYTKKTPLVIKGILSMTKSMGKEF